MNQELLNNQLLKAFMMDKLSMEIDAPIVEIEINKMIVDMSESAFIKVEVDIFYEAKHTDYNQKYNFHTLTVMAWLYDKILFNKL